MVTTVATTNFVGTVNNGSLIAAIAVSLLVGVVGFLSPCVLPLVPGYLSYVAGLSGATEQSAESSGGSSGSSRTAMLITRTVQRRTVLGALLFVAGFTAIFVATGALFGTLGSQIAEHRVGLERFFGVFTIVMGLAFIGKIPFLQREVKIHRLPRAGLVGAPILGITFGLAWTPCLAPTFSAVTQLATIQATAGRGAVLSAAYCIGLGVPFILVAFGVGWVTGALRVVRRHARMVSQFGGALLILFGVAMLTGVWDTWMYTLNSTFAGSFIGSGL
jgi:cytochrome c-type biogenesis protein